MAWPTAAISGTTLNNTIRTDEYRCTQYISLLPNDVVQTTTLSTSTSLNYAQMTCADTISSNVKIGMTVLVSLDSSVAAGMDVEVILRVRRTPSGTTLYVSESDVALNTGVGTWYIHILDDYRIQQKLGRVDPSTGTYYKDYDWTFVKPRPLITNLQSAYAGFISGSNLTLSFAPVGDAVADGATISSWLWDVDDGTITVGTTTTQNITATFPEGFRWITLTVTDSNGVAGWRRIPIWAHGSTFTTATGFNGAEITGNWDTGYTASISAFDGVQDYIDETLCVIWRVEYYDGTETNLINNVDFVGRLRNETTRGYGDGTFSTVVDDARFTVEGPGQLLQRIPAPSLYMFDAASTPTVWDNFTTLTPKRAIAHLLKESCTFAELHDVEFTSKHGDDYHTYILDSSGGDMLSAVNAISEGVNGHMEFMPDGSSRFADDVRMGFTAATEYATFSDSDYLSITINADHVQRYARTDVSGAAYESTARILTPRVFTAPGAVGTQGYEVGTLRRQIFKVNSGGAFDAYTRAVKYLRLLNARFTIDIDFPDGYHFIMPSWYLCYELDITSALNNRGYSIDTSTFACNSITHRQDNLTGTREVSATFVEVDVVTSESYNEGVAYPATGPQAAAHDGNLVVVWTNSDVWVTREFKQTDTPEWYKITPLDDGNNPLGANDSIQVVKWSRQSDYGRVYMLTRDAVAGTAKVWYKLSALDLYEEWKPGTAYTGNYDNIRVTSEDQHLYMFSNPTSGNRDSRFSDDSGQTFTTAQTIGTAASTSFGADIVLVGPTQLAAYSGNVGRATTEGGAYSSYSTISDVKAIWIPRWEFGFAFTSGMTYAEYSPYFNYSTTTPEYLAATDDNAGTEHLYKVTNSGATTTDIQPNDGTYDGRLINANMLTMSQRNGNEIAGIFLYNATYKLTTSTDAGSNWTYTALSGIASYIRARPSNSRELYMANLVPKYSPDWGATIATKNTPEGTSYIIGIEVY